MQKHSRLFWFRFASWGRLALLPASISLSSAAGAQDCSIGPPKSAVANASSVSTLPVNVFGRVETGWLFYETLIGHEIGTECTAGTAGFARSLAAWQATHGVGSTGIVDATTLEKMKILWQRRRPFVVESRDHCPDPPAEQTLQRALVSESYGGKVILLRAGALAAYRAMVAAARGQGLVPPHTQLLTIFSAYRSPSYDAARCALQRNCQGVVRASCSAHRTGYAMDINLGAAAGFTPDSSNDVNRIYISQSAAYRWLVRNADRYGLVNYAFEPWHWEFLGLAASR